MKVREEASRISTLNRLCEWCGRTDCEDLLRGGPTADGHAAAAQQRRLSMFALVEHAAPMQRSQSDQRSRRADLTADAAVDRKVRRAATVGRTGPTRRAQSQGPGRSRQPESWHFRNSAGISWTYPTR